MEGQEIALFKGEEIRKTINGNKWWFSVVDVAEALTESVNHRDYWFSRLCKDGIREEVRV